MESSEREVQTAQQWSEYGPSTMTEGELLLNTRGTGFKESIFGSLFSDLHTNPKIRRVKSKDLIQNPASTASYFRKQNNSKTSIFLNYKTS